ncbi:questin oxidase family protein [Actinoplanes sp. NEAU-A12]|uniref:Questin oxidase family protein n=1 Tax=Actinoplanes sandaracinus TaxID=3045177 RepID=A0ABT6WWP6_9ACTN|nr:questin oxidase family protein [Actinoplanes sandaracinus]MDI6104173.1 questin oxidase family protein [Actinoplanes sandaracinus]
MALPILDEVYERVRHTGPERDGWLSNHAPMAAEALVRHGHEHVVHRWLDGYGDRLEERPRGIRSIAAAEWRDPLGDPVRTGDWLNFFEREVADDPWRVVLARWWPRLLPGIAAGATHGVIRTGHAVRTLLDEETDSRVEELGQGLAYWAARWQPLAPPGAGPYVRSDPRIALDTVPRVPDQRFGIRARLAQLADLGPWAGAVGAVPGEPDTDATARLAAIVDAAVIQHSTHGHASPVMLVHAATAPNAVLRALPALPQTLWEPSVAAAWAAAAAVTAAYAPSEGLAADHGPATTDIDDLLHRAVDSGDAHAIKFADTAIDTYVHSGDQALLGGIAHSLELIIADR